MSKYILLICFYIITVISCSTQNNRSVISYQELIQEKSETQLRFEKAAEYIKAFDYDNAINEYTSLFNENILPHYSLLFNCLAHLYRGESYESIQDYPNAMNDYNWVVENYKNVEKLENEVAKNLLPISRQQVLKNEFWFEVGGNYGFDLSDLDLKAKFYIARVFRKTKDYDKSMKELDFLIKTEPSVDKYLERALVYMAKGNFDLAYKDYLFVFNSKDKTIDERLIAEQGLQNSEKALAKAKKQLLDKTKHLSGYKDYKFDMTVEEINMLLPEISESNYNYNINKAFVFIMYSLYYDEIVKNIPNPLAGTLKITYYQTGNGYYQDNDLYFIFNENKLKSILTCFNNTNILLDLEKKLWKI